jgi:hypothetical protein
MIDEINPEELDLVKDEELTNEERIGNTEESTLIIRDEDGLIDRSLKEGVVQTVNGPVDVANVKRKHKSPKTRGSANMGFVDNPPKPKKEKRDNANPPVKKLTNNDKRVGKSGGTRVDVGSGEKVGTEAAITPAKKRTGSAAPPRGKKTSTPVAAPKTPKAATPRPPCLCGCKQFPSGKKSKYLPGHDAIHHSALKKAKEAEANKKGKVKK